MDSKPLLSIFLWRSRVSVAFSLHSDWFCTLSQKNRWRRYWVDFQNVNWCSAGKSKYEKRKRRAECRSRAAIKPIIGHVKHDCRMGRNYIKGQIGDKINALMAAAGFNFRRLLRKMKAEVIFFFFQIQKILNPKPSLAPKLILMTYITSLKVSC